jgi:hypothetical protein
MSTRPTLRFIWTLLGMLLLVGCMVLGYGNLAGDWYERDRMLLCAVGALLSLTVAAFLEDER